MRCSSIFALLLTFGMLPRTASAEPADPPASGTRWVWLTLPRFSQPARVEAMRVSAEGRSEADQEAFWGKICDAPCALWVPAGSRLRVRGDFPPGRPFRVLSQRTVHLDVRPASDGYFVVGAALIPLSAIAGFAGYATIGISRWGGESGGSTAEAGVGVVLLSVVGLVTGIVLVARNWKTDTQQIDPTVNGLSLARGLSFFATGLHF